MERLAGEVDSKEIELKQLKAEKGAAHAKYDALLREKDQVQAEMDGLFSKQGRQTKFQSAVRWPCCHVLAPHACLMSLA